MMRNFRLRSLLVFAVLFYATAGLALDPYYNVTLSGSTALVKNASGTQVYASADHQAAIQWAINNLPAGRTTKAKVMVTGNFTVDDTILLKSYLVFELAGKITLKNSVNKDLMHTATITVGETDIELIGGTYDANKNNQSKTTGGYYCILLKHARNSIFRDFIVQNCGQDGFILDTRCSNNVCSKLLGQHTGLPETGISNGNGMGDRGDNNTWTDCVTDDTYSDGFVVKCRNAVWTRCLAKNGYTGAGFGLFCDTLICSNKFYDCEVHHFKGRAFSLRKPTETDKGDDPIRDNYFEVYIHDSGVKDSSEDQCGFRLWSSRNTINGLELIRNNKVHLLVNSTYDQGFYIKDSHVSGTTGTIVCYSNHPDAVVEGHNNTLTFLVPDINKDTITKAGVSNSVTIRTISRTDTNTSWAARKYYALLDGAGTSASCHIDIPTANVTKAVGDTLYVKVSASDPDGVDRVKVYMNGVEGPSDSSDPYEFNLALPSAGTFTLTAAVKDLLGNYTASDNSRTITVTSGTTTTTVPNVINLTQAAATTSITTAGLVVGTVSTAYSSTVAAGKVISQTPGGGTTVTLGSSVALSVSLGPVTGGGTTVTFTSVAAHDGYVDESSETSNLGGAMAATLTTGTAIRVGDTGARKQRKGFVSFNTASLPDTAVVTSATLKLKRGGILGTPSVLGAITVDIKNTSIGFGTTEALEIIDFQAAASKSNVGTLSYPTANDTWATATLNADGISRINLTDHTQFRVRFVTDDDNDSADDYLGFYSGENATAANRPVLEVTYQ